MEHEPDAHRAGLGRRRAGLGPSSRGASEDDLGRRKYDSHCASCHGVASKRKGGASPLNGVRDVSQGRGHGISEMPVWGQDDRVKAGEYYVDVPYNPEVFVRTRILALIEYLSRLQAK